MYQRKEMLVCHAVATPYRSRSHFDGQDLLENGAASAHAACDGWLNRALALYGAGAKGAGLAVGQSVPLILRGDVPVGAWAPRILPRVEDDFLARLGGLYRSDRLLGPAFAEVTRAQAMSDEVARGDEMGSDKQPMRGAKALPAVMGAVGQIWRTRRGRASPSWKPRAGTRTPTRGSDRAAGQQPDGARRRARRAPDRARAGMARHGRRHYDRVRADGAAERHGRHRSRYGRRGLPARRPGRGRARHRPLAGLAERALFEGRDLTPTTDVRALFRAALTDHLGLPEADGPSVFPDGQAAPQNSSALDAGRAGFVPGFASAHTAGRICHDEQDAQRGARQAAGGRGGAQALRPDGPVGEIAKIAKACDHDWIFIDMEHAPLTLDKAVEISVAALDTGITPIVRVPGHEAFHISRVLDGGAMGVVVPHVNTAEEARRAVDACRYAPIGHRSAMGGYAQLGFESLPIREAAAYMNEHTLLAVMIETPQAVENVEAIAAVEGIDIVYIGSNDLLMEMGLPGQFEHPALEKAAHRIVEASLANGKYRASAASAARKMAEKFVRMGSRFLTTHSDLASAMEAASARAKAARRGQEGADDVGR
jgi:2-keto-3-deoxy-L-rhamnonate aldolase RhmA